MRNRKCVQLNALVCLFVVTIIFSLGMSSVADAAFGSAQQLSGTYIRSDQQASEIPTDFFEFSNWYFTVHNPRNSVGSKGKYSITGDMIEFVYSNDKIEVFKFSRTQNAIMLNNGDRTTTYVLVTSERKAQIEASIEKVVRRNAEVRKAAEEARKEEEERKAEKERLIEEARKEKEKRRMEEARKAAEERRMEEERRTEEARKFNQAPLAGFIVLSESLMTWNDAKNYCLQKGGRLPRINYSDSWDGYHPWDDRDRVFIDGFGAMARGGPWLADLPNEENYWTGTEQSDIPGVSWTVGDFFGEFVIYNGAVQDSNLLRVLCVPSATPEERKAEEALRVEAVRKAEEGRKAEEARRAEAVRKAVETAKAEEEALRADGGRKLRALGFIALSESHMNWVEAKIFCRQKGGRLPRVNNSDLLASDVFGNHVDGFGSFGRPWDEIGLPRSGYGYWTGTVVSDRPGHAWDVGGDQGTFCAVPNDPQDSRKRVVCVPLDIGGAQ